MRKRERRGGEEWIEEEGKEGGEEWIEEGERGMKQEGGGVDLDEAVKYVVTAGIPCAISFIMSKRYATDLPRILDLVRKWGVSILLLSYKPVIGDIENVVPLKEIRRIAFGLRDQGIKVAIDSMLSNECHMSERLATISHTGDVHPCSFVREPMGNITESPFRDIWTSRPTKSPCPYAYVNE